MFKYETRDGGAAVGQWGNKRVECSGNLKKIIANYACLCSATMLTSKIITEITENHSEFSGWAHNFI